jgi:hypothetical protein
MGNVFGTESQSKSEAVQAGIGAHGMGQDIDDAVLAATNQRI